MSTCMTLVKWHVRRQEGKLCRMAVPKSHEVVVLLKLGFFECFLQAIEDDHPSENHKLLVHKLTIRISSTPTRGSSAINP